MLHELITEFYITQLPGEQSTSSNELMSQTPSWDRKGEYAQQKNVANTSRSAYMYVRMCWCVCTLFMCMYK